MAQSGRQSFPFAKRTASAARSSRSSASSRSRKASTARVRHVVCLSNEGYPASLEVRKIYVAFADHEGERARMVRVVDESGEDYVYPKAFFAAK